MFDYDERILAANAERWHFKEIQEILRTAEKNFFDVVEPSREQDYNYLLNENFASAILYAKEISALLYNGFPDGAMALAKNLYETMILLCFFEKHKEDEELLARYFDDRKIKAMTDSISLYSFLETGAENEEIRSGIEQMNLDRKKNYLEYKKKYEEILQGGSFNPYWWVADLANGHSFGAIHRQSAWYRSIFRHIYDMAVGQTHAGSFLENGINTEPQTAPDTEGFQIPVCFSLTAFENICNIVFANYEIDESNIKKRIADITSPMFSAIWK